MTRTTVPVPVTLARVLLAVVALAHLSVVLLTVTGQTALRRDLATTHPTSDVERLAATQTSTALAVHLPLLLLTGVLAYTLGTASPWALRPATVSQAFAIAFAHLSTPDLAVLQPLVPLAVAAAAGIIGLLWLPRTSRTFFAAHPRSRHSRRTASASTGPKTG